jgi:hypothetical protein
MVTYMRCWRFLNLAVRLVMKQSTPAACSAAFFGRRLCPAKALVYEVMAMACRKQIAERLELNGISSAYRRATLLVRLLPAIRPVVLSRR